MVWLDRADPGRNQDWSAMKPLALLIILVGAVLVVIGRVTRNTQLAIAAYAVLGVGLVLGLLSR
jgi:hypothetical protein